MAVRTSHNSLIAVLIFLNQNAADALIAHENKLMTEIKFEEEWFLEDELLQLYQNIKARNIYQNNQLIGIAIVTLK